MHSLTPQRTNDDDDCHLMKVTFNIPVSDLGNPDCLYFHVSWHLCEGPLFVCLRVLNDHVLLI